MNDDPVDKAIEDSINSKSAKPPTPEIQDITKVDIAVAIRERLLSYDYYHGGELEALKSQVDNCATFLSSLSGDLVSKGILTLDEVEKILPHGQDLQSLAEEAACRRR